MERAKTDKIEILLDGSREASVREEIHASSRYEQKTVKKKIPFYLRSEKTLERSRRRRYQRQKTTVTSL